MLPCYKISLFRFTNYFMPYMSPLQKVQNADFYLFQPPIP